MVQYCKHALRVIFSKQFISSSFQISCKITRTVKLWEGIFEGVNKDIDRMQVRTEYTRSRKPFLMLIYCRVGEKPQKGKKKKREIVLKNFIERESWKLLSNSAC